MMKKILTSLFVWLALVNVALADYTPVTPISRGGTGQTTQQTAINALAGATTNRTFLRGNGSNDSMAAIQAADVPTLNQNTTGTADHLSGALLANQVLGSLTAVAPTGQSVPSCSTSSSALQWTSGTGFGCNTAINASTVTTNANLTGPITSVGNATSVMGAAAGMVYAGATPSFTATPTLGVNTSTAGTLSLANGGVSGASVTIQNPSATSAYNFNLPSTAGAVGAILTSGGGVNAANVWLPDVSTGQVLTSAGTTTIPAFSNTLPSAVQGNITSTGTISSGTWQGTAIDVAHGGTGQTSYTDGQLLIGNTTGNTLTKATITAGTGITVTNGHGTITIANSGVTSQTMPRTVQTGTYAPTTTDNASEISFAGASADATWTIAAGATNGAGWYAVFNNPTSHVLTIKVTTNNIDGITGSTGFPMYPQEVRLVQCDGTNYFTTILHGFRLQIDVASSPFTFVTPPGYTEFPVELWGAGGGGGTATNGGGGGGGAYRKATISAASMSTSQTVTIGAGAAATAGGNTTIGSLLTGYGGGTAPSTNTGAGGGGGLTAIGSNSATSTGGNGGASGGVAGGAGGPDNNNGGDSAAGAQAGGGGSGGTGTNFTALVGGNSVDGGAGGSGGCSGTGTSSTGGSSINGGGGGVGGGCVTNTAGQSVNGGNGGLATVAGSVPGGGGGRNAAGGAGRAIIRGQI